jgi:hypothetical protein
LKRFSTLTSLSIAIVHNERVKSERLVAERAFREQLLLIPGFSWKFQAG